MSVIASQAARELGVSTKTLADWADRGRIRTTRTPAGWRLYDWADVQKIKAQMAKRAA